MRRNPPNTGSPARCPTSGRALSGSLGGLDTAAKQQPDDIDGLTAKIAYSIPQLSAATSLSRSTLYNAVKTGDLKTVKVGRRTVVLREDAEQWLRHLQRDEEDPLSV